MNKKFLAGTLIFTCICFIISAAYACVSISVEISDYEKHTVATSDESRLAEVAAGVEEGGPATEWSWTWPSGLYLHGDIGENDYNSNAFFWSPTTGRYKVWAGAENASSSYDSDWAYVYVFKMDLDISGVSDEDEEDPGGYICVNDDDDDKDNTPDKDETGTVSGEDDLVEISLSYEPSDLSPGYIELKIPNNIKVWSSSEKGTLVVPNGTDYYKRWSLGSQPSTLWVEGYSAGTANLWLLYSNSTNPAYPVYPSGDKNHDPVKFNVCDVLVDKLQYWDGISSQWVDIGSTLYIAKDDSVTFKAIPDPSDASWPSGKPVWGGTAGASGTGETKVITFSTLSSSTSDYKTVTAECNNTVTVNVIVYDFDGTTTPYDNFPGHFPATYGIGEMVQLSCDITPTGLTGSQVGGLHWWESLGKGTVSSVTDNGTADYDAGPYSGTALLFLTVASGPSSGISKYYSRSVIVPSAGHCTRRSGTDIWHLQNYFSVGLMSDIFIGPNYGSFLNVEFKEDSCNPGQATGMLSNIGNHPAWGSWYPNLGGVTGKVDLPSNMDAAQIFIQQVTQVNQYYNGYAYFDIPWKYKVDAVIGNITTVRQEFRSYTGGNHGVTKYSESWYYVNHTDPTAITGW